MADSVRCRHCNGRIGKARIAAARLVSKRDPYYCGEVCQRAAKHLRAVARAQKGKLCRTLCGRPRASITKKRGDGSTYVLDLMTCRECYNKRVRAANADRS